MKTKEKKQLGSKTRAELQTEVHTAKGALSDLLLDKAQGKLKNTSSLTNKRKEIAVLLTMMRHMELTAAIEEK